MDRLLLPFRQNKILNTIFISNVFISIHYALIVYINSSLLSNFFSDTQISYLYIIGSILDTIMLVNSSKILESIGGFRFLTYAATLEFISTIGLMLSDKPFLISMFFLIHVFTISLIIFNMDVFLEKASPDETKTGEIRAAYLTITSLCIVISPLILSFLVSDSDYTKVYFLSSIFLLPFYLLVKKFEIIETKKIEHIKIKETISEYLANKDIYNIFVCQLLLQFFYAYMIIYMPLYLTQNIGFSWSEIGMMFTIMLLPFVLFELPIGELEDDRYGEKEFLTIGFIIIGMATMFMSFITVKVFWMWTAILFISRIGASFIEVSNESYFFKHVDQRKAGVISFFRVARPISFIIAPLLATIILGFLPFQYIFIIIGTIMILGTKYSLSLKDTK